MGYPYLWKSHNFNITRQLLFGYVRKCWYEIDELIWTIDEKLLSHQPSDVMRRVHPHGIFLILASGVHRRAQAPALERDWDGKGSRRPMATIHSTTIYSIPDLSVHQYNYVYIYVYKIYIYIYISNHKRVQQSTVQKKQKLWITSVTKLRATDSACIGIVPLWIPTGGPILALHFRIVGAQGGKALCRNVLLGRCQGPRGPGAQPLSNGYAFDSSNTGV